MTVKLIEFTGKGRVNERIYAARLLQFTKNTRLEMTPAAFEDFMAAKFDMAALYEELDYMGSTIASSWEFVDLTFAISGVSRACAQQITRTRTASYAMQSQRVTNMADVTCHVPASVPPEQLVHYQLALSTSLASYQKLVDAGVSLEDARGVLPMNTCSNLLAKYNFRAWVDLIRARDSLRVQSEYRDVIQGMREEVIKVWPWAKVFIVPKAEKAIALIEALAKELPQEQRTRLAKAADLIKKETA